MRAGPHMTLKQLEAFYLAANLGSFALAAQRLHITQSSLSKRIAELESATDCDLFDRSSQRAQLTEAGHRLMPLVAKMLELQHGIRNAASSNAVLSGTCRFGISELGALTWLPRLVERVRREHPALVLQAHVDLGRRLERLVVRGELDFAVVPGPPDDRRVQSHTVGQVRFAWFAAPRRLRIGTVLKAKELERHPVITMTEGSGLTGAFEAWAADQGLRVQPIVASNSLMAIVGLTIADVGISFLPEDYMRPWVEGGALVSLASKPPLPALNYCFLHRADDNRAIVRMLLECVTQEANFSALTGLAKKAKNKVKKRL
jgi:DNA-binding transcriptional LysR family regulator